MGTKFSDLLADVLLLNDLSNDFFIWPYASFLKLTYCILIEHILAFHSQSLYKNLRLLLFLRDNNLRLLLEV